LVKAEVENSKIYFEKIPPDEEVPAPVPHNFVKLDEI